MKLLGGSGKRRPSSSSSSCWLTYRCPPGPRGIGLHTAAACYAAGAAGVVLDMQLALTRESPLPEVAKATIACMDRSETVCLGAEIGEAYRVYARPGLT